MKLIDAGNAEAYLTEPTGRYVGSASSVSFCIDERASGLILWGKPSRDEINAIVKTMPVSTTVSSLSTPRTRLIDVRRLAVPHEEAFDAFVDYVRVNAALLAVAVERIAVIHGGGLLGAAIAGLSELTDAPYRLRRFDASRDALAWLELDHAWAAELDELVDAVRDAGELRQELRAVLEADLLGAELAASAAALHCSARTLQRRLQQLGSSFQRELHHARIERARVLLSVPDASIKEVAFAVGCRSVQHFGALFQRVVGVMPSEWREQQARGRSPQASSKRRAT